MSLHEDISRKVNIIFVNHPIDPRGGGSNPPRPPRPPRYFGLLMVNPSWPPLPPNGPYRQPLNYHEYVKDSDLDAHVKVLLLKLIMKWMMQKLLICLVLPLKNIMSNWCNNYMGDYLDCTFAKL